MPTITFNATEELVQKVSTLPESERDAWLSEVLEDAFDDEKTPTEAVNAPALTQTEINDLKEAFADMDAGRVTRGETFFAELRSELNLPPHPFGITKAKNGAL